MAFYLPQLVQQLRADPGGLVEAFLLDGAAKSQLFAHHLICTLRVRVEAALPRTNMSRSRLKPACRHMNRPAVLCMQGFVTAHIAD